MNNFLNNLNNRERNLIMAALLMVVTLILFFIVSNTIQSMNFSSKKLDKAKKRVTNKVTILENKNLKLKFIFDSISIGLSNDNNLFSRVAIIAPIKPMNKWVLMKGRLIKLLVAPTNCIVFIISLLL